MMKKLLVLALVLVMATVSQAAIKFTATGEVDHQLTVSAGATITINMVADGTCAGYEISAVEGASVNANGQIETIANKGGTASNLSYDGFTLDDSSGVKNYQGDVFAYLAAHLVGGVTAGNVLASFTYVVGPTLGYWVAPFKDGATAAIPVDSVPANNYDAYGYGAVGTDTHQLVYGLHLVPEPITIALLGLGGLFLRRRK